uniref:Uncharacterized protein n=1 Tax=Rhizophora mucronata TaxID=61149 RepID=A0A2P2NM48_RHIMU
MNTTGQQNSCCILQSYISI